MERVKEHSIAPSDVDGDVLVTVEGEVRWGKPGTTTVGGTGDYWTKAEIGDIPSADFVATFEGALT